MIEPFYSALDGRVRLYRGDWLEVMSELYRSGMLVDAVITDPPYGLKFMQKRWDYSVPSSDVWRQAMKMAKPGAHLLAFGGSRTYHRLACAVEDGGWEVRDQIMWIHAQGMPKSRDISKAVDKRLGAKRKVIGIKPGHEEFAGRTTKGHIDFKDGTDGFDRPWMHDDDARERYHQQTAPATIPAMAFAGCGTNLKPAHEPIVLARRPFFGTTEENMLMFWTGAIHIDSCRIPSGKDHADKCASVVGIDSQRNVNCFGKSDGARKDSYSPCGRWPSNVLHDGSDEVCRLFPSKGCTDDGSASRFFYCAKASKSERGTGNNHSTVKPVALMEYLIELVTFEDQLVLDFCMGSGTTGVAAVKLGRQFIGIDSDAQPGSCEIAKTRIEEAINNLGASVSRDYRSIRQLV